MRESISDEEFKVMLPDGKKKGSDPIPNPKKTMYIINAAIQQ